MNKSRTLTTAQLIQKSPARHYCRTASGQAILSGTALLLLLSTLTVGLLLALADMSILGNYNERLQAAASDIAERAAAEGYHYGVERRYDPVALQSSQSGFRNDRAYLDAELSAMGVDPRLVSNYTVVSQDAKVRDLPVKMYIVSFDVWGIPICGGVLPAVLPLHVRATSTNYSEQAEQSHGCALLLVVDPRRPEIQRGLRVPIYNATLGRNTPADPSFLHAGAMIGEPPEAYLRLNCDNVGFVAPPR